MLPIYSFCCFFFNESDSRSRSILTKTEEQCIILSIDRIKKKVSAFFLFQRDARGVGSYLGGGSISDGGGMLTIMAKLMKQELASDAEEEGLVPALSGRFTSMRKVPSLSDLSDPESSLGEFFFSIRLFPMFETLTVTGDHLARWTIVGSSSINESSCLLNLVDAPG